MTIASETRDAVRNTPFLLEALRADVVNYRAAASYLDVEADEETVATALRRFASDLTPRETQTRDARVTMQSRVGFVDDPADSVLSVGGRGVAPGAGTWTAVQATGEVDGAALAAVLARFDAHGVDVRAAGVVPEDAGDDEDSSGSSGSLVVVVTRRDGAVAVRHVEAALSAVPE